jgi:hypothetical protein
MNTLLLAIALASQSCPGGYCPAPPRQVIPVRRASQAQPGYQTDSIPQSGSYAQIVVRIANETGDRTSYGSGVILTRSGLVLTCKHLFRDGVGRITVRRSDGKSWRAKFLAVDKQHDLGAIQIADPGAIPEIWYAKEQPTMATLIGFPGGGTDAQATTGAYQPNDVVYGFPAAKGVSGGPLFCRGRLVLAGVLWGSDDRTSVLTSIDDVKKFLVQPTCFPFFRRPNGPIQIVNNNPPAAVPGTVLPEPTPLPVTPTPIAVPVVTPVPPASNGTAPAPAVIQGPEGPAGKDGKPGINGKDGLPGPAGKDGSAATLPAVAPITFRIISPDGTISEQQVNPLRTKVGDVVTINLQTTAPVLNPAASAAK